MTSADARGPRTCPYLGIAGDPASHFSFAEGSHRCFAQGNPRQLELAYQASVCMGSGHLTCRRYVHAQRRAAKARGRDARPRRRFGWAAVLGRVAAVVVMFVLVMFSVALGRSLLEQPAGALLTDPPVGQASASLVAPSPTTPTTPSPAPTPSPTLAPTPTPAASPTASPATPIPLTTPTASPTPAPTPIIHRVRKGETLSYLARLYGVSKRAIAEANDLADDDLIYRGQRLIIPLDQP